MSGEVAMTWLRRTGALVALLLATIALIAAPVPARATDHQVQILSPLNGSVTSAPGQHWNPYGGDWAMDIGAGGGTPVNARFRAATGGLSLSIEHVGPACSGGAEGGQQVRVRVHIAGVNVGYVVYSHLTDIPQQSGTISNNHRLGTLAAGLPINEDCWTGSHVHLEPYNQTSYSCFVARSSGSPVSTSSVVGVLGGEWVSDLNQSCPAGALEEADPISPEVSVSPTSGDQDTTFHGTASGFTPNASVTQTAYEPDGSPYPTSQYTQERTTNGSGEFTWLWFWEPNDPFGEYTLHFRDEESGEETAVSFTIAEPDEDQDEEGGEGEGTDSTPPETTITSGPSGSVEESSARFDFTANEPDVTYECRLDEGSWQECAPPVVYDGLESGEHTLRVRATDGQGNVEETAARRTWTVVRSFSDVSGTHAEAIALVAEAGIAEGYEDGTYRPNGSVTRAQMASFLTRALGLPPGESGAFPDVSGTHADAIASVAEAGIAEGYEDGTYRPNGSVTRAQMASFLARALNL